MSNSAITPYDLHWMTLAVNEGRRGLGLTSPNPPVGAVLVAGEKAIGLGHHRKAGGPHAEIEALNDARQGQAGKIRGATLYITLEPCCTAGRTPPCTDAIIAAGIQTLKLESSKAPRSKMAEE